MNRLKVFLAASLVVIVAGSDAFGIVRVARRLGVLEVYGGANNAVGEFGSLPGYDFLINYRKVNIPAEDAFNTGFHLGIRFGQLRNAHFLGTIGFQFTDYNLNDIVPITQDIIIFFQNKTHLRQYDLTLDLNFLPLDISQYRWSPYVGLGLQAGIISWTVRGYDAENEANIAGRLNFGAEVVLWGNNRQMMSLASINSWDFAASNDRPRMFNFGGGLRFWFRSP
jgi:hypothetical protein